MEATLYAELMKDPLIVAALSALIGVGLGMVATILYAAWTHRRKRRSTLRVLLNQLQNHKQQLSELGDNLGKNRICGTLDPSPVLHFLNGNVVTLPKDQKLVTALYNHLDNIEVIRSAMHIIGMRAAGWTNVQDGRQEALEQSLKESIPNVQAALDSCLDELKNCITPPHSGASQNQ